jgi:broad specificity phosphatase PhoE
MRRRRFLAMLGACLGAGHVLLIRHAATDPGIGDPPGFQLGQCGTQRNLSERGRREAQALGVAMQAGGVTVGPVWSSRWCRCLDTARLATLKETRNVALVTHDVNIRALAREAVVPGGIVVARMEGGRLAVLGQLQVGLAGRA